jgi:hypothetical protein
MAAHGLLPRVVVLIACCSLLSGTNAATFNYQVCVCAVIFSDRLSHSFLLVHPVVLVKRPPTPTSAAQRHPAVQLVRFPAVAAPALRAAHPGVQAKDRITAHAPAAAVPRQR